MNVSEYTTSQIVVTSWVWMDKAEASTSAELRQPATTKTSVDIFKTLRQWLDGLNVRDRQLAHRICKLIPAQCPFERDIKLFGLTLVHIPPMCKLNPLYDELVGLRFRALCYLADECGEDVGAYC